MTISNKAKDILLGAAIIIGVFGTPLTYHYFSEEYGGWTVAIPIVCAGLFLAVRQFAGSGGANHR